MTNSTQIADQNFLGVRNGWHIIYISRNSQGLYEHFEHIQYRFQKFPNDFPTTLNTPYVVYNPITYIKSRFIPYIYILYIFTFLYENTYKHTISKNKKWYRSVLLTKYNSRSPRAIIYSISIESSLSPD